MPLKGSELLQQLHRKRADFNEFSYAAQEDLRRYRKALTQAAALNEQQLNEQLADYINPGARPLEPLGTIPYWVIPFQRQWSNREQSLEWVRACLEGVTTFAVDGSQIFPSGDLSIPVALVQVGWYENPHSPSGTYDKDVRLKLLSPVDLQPPTQQRPLDRQVNMQRFGMETEQLTTFIKAHAHCRDCLVFLDGSLVASFAEAFDPECRAWYVNCLLNLVRASEEYRVPLVAYIDTSHASDLVVMLQHLQQLSDAPSLNDAALMGARMNWGDRTPLFRCVRGSDSGKPGILRDYQEYAQGIAFTYLKTNDRPPVRLEMPVWIYEEGLYKQVIDWVTAEVIVGRGYPYAIETADQVAVLQSRDREMFYRLLQDWAEQESVPLSFSRKMISKMLRRS